MSEPAERANERANERTGNNKGTNDTGSYYTCYYAYLLRFGHGPEPGAVVHQRDVLAPREHPPHVLEAVSLVTRVLQRRARRHALRGAGGLKRRVVRRLEVEGNPVALVVADGAVPAVGVALASPGGGPLPAPLVLVRRLLLLTLLLLRRKTHVEPAVLEAVEGVLGGLPRQKARGSSL
eukprot:1185976-Prorocentrum_minimum.AAC.6